jgi:hypothetical protein
MHNLRWKPKMIRKVMITLAGIGVSCGLALAGNPPGTGQPNQDCADFGTHPGKAASAPGSAFNDNGKAGSVYANPDSTGGIHSGNSHVVSQYDVACFQQFNRVSKQSTQTHGGGHR